MFDCVAAEDGLLIGKRREDIFSPRKKSQNA